MKVTRNRRDTLKALLINALYEEREYSTTVHTDILSVYLETLTIEVLNKDAKKVAQELLGIKNLTSWFIKNSKHYGKD